MTEKQPRISFSRFKISNPNSIAKEFKLDENNELVKGGGGNMQLGEVHKVECASMQEVAEVISNLSNDQALAYGVPIIADELFVASKNNHSQVEYQRKFIQKSQKGLAKAPTITRTKDQFKFSESEGLLMLDIDCPDDKVGLDKEDVLDKLSQVSSDIKKAPMVLLPSSSSYIYNEDVKLTDLTGLRILVGVKDARDIPRAGDVLNKRLWRSGYGRIEVSKAGSLLERSLVDAVVWQPERLDYCGASVCVEPLRQEKPEIEVRNDDCELLDTKTALPDLTDEEYNYYRNLVEIAKKEKMVYAEGVKEAWVERRVNESLEEYEEVSEEKKEELRKQYRQSVSGQVLGPEHIIYMSDKSKVKVKTILANCDNYDERYCCDPLEPDYNNNTMVAWIKVKDTKCPMIYSHAHGGIKYYLQSLLKIDPVDYINQYFALVSYGSRVCVMREKYDHKGNITYDFLTKADFKTLFENEHVTETNKKGESYYTPLGEYWLKSNKRRQYDGVVFDPSGNASNNYFNFFKGFDVEPIKGEWSKFKNHIFEVICSEDKRLYEYVIAWMARIVQDPGGKKPGVAIVLQGKEGTGKGTFVNNFGRIFGPHFLQISNQSQVTGNFNSHLKNVILLFVDEGIWGGNKAAEGVLKTMITEDTLNIEPKGKDVVSLDNHINMIIASNNDWVIPTGPEARRFLALEVSDKYMQDTHYFNEINEEMVNGGTEAMMQELLEMDISNVNLRNVPRTKTLFEQMLESMDSIDSYWFEVLKDEGLPRKINRDDKEVREHRLTKRYFWDEIVFKEDLADDYYNFCDRMKIKHPKHKGQLMKRILKLCPSLQSRKMYDEFSERRLNAFLVPPIEQCRKEFQDVYNVPIEWEEPTKEELCTEEEKCECHAVQ